MRRGYKYVEVGGARPLRTTVDATASEFAETMGYGAREPGSQGEFIDSHDVRWVRELHDVLRELLDPGRTVLSIGSGAGEHDVLLLRAGYDVVATDLVIEPLRATARLFPELRTAEFDVFADAPPVEPDDVLVTGLDFYFDDARTAQLFERLRALVPRGGRLVFTLRYRNNPLTWAIDRIALPVLAMLRRARGTRLARKEHGFRRSEREIRRFGRAAGFELGRMRRAGYGVELERLGITSPAAARIDRRLGLLTVATVFEFRG